MLLDSVSPFSSGYHPISHLLIEGSTFVKCVELFGRLLILLIVLEIINADVDKVQKHLQSHFVLQARSLFL